jgi:hypothetical protein
MSSLPPRCPRPGLGRGRAASASPTLARLPVRGVHAKGPPQALISRPPPLEPPTRALAAALRRHRNPSAAAFGSPPSPPLRRLEAVLELRLEVSSAPASQVVEFELRRDRKTSPEFVGRAAASTGRSAATPPRPPPHLASRAAHRCHPRFKPCTRALDWVCRRALPPFAAARRRAPPSSAGRRRFGRSHAIPAVGLRSDAPV